MRLRDSECITCDNYYLNYFIYLFIFYYFCSDPLDYMSVRECTIDYLIETSCIYICAILCFLHVTFHVPVYYHVN